MKKLGKNNNAKVNTVQAYAGNCTCTCSGCGCWTWGYDFTATTRVDSQVDLTMKLFWN
ncbi:CLI_3235 family bacteriocin precursor [Clostridium beijerinckii]|uniref:CLI_3235 family bacteriocin precursor n=1 Tax=Clostridium beijerinckii TaxID=1520 RepID=UPI00157148AF|nr:CLI_3235 family bacteriocin precursor [Clostridium beijerinckii]NRT74802.1 putative bacteriocin precursor [Clostridium beijerinckii]